ncbi:MAG: serine hydrolase [Acidobacteriota bacterium]
MWNGKLKKAWPVALLLALCSAHAVGAETGLEAIRTAAEQAHSDAVVIQRDGEVVAEWYFGEERGPIELMSVVKSVVAVGVGRLLELGIIDSVDQPVHSVYPEWNQGRKKDITIRHLLNHTSGLQDHRSAGVEIYPSPNAIRLALAAELSEDPGSAFRYNNKATNLLAGIIHEASGQRMDQFLVQELFRPLGIERYQWYYDASGNPHAMAGLRLHAIDLAKIGQLVLDRGVWNGQRLIPEAYLDDMLAQGQAHYLPCGLLWWRLPSETRYLYDRQRRAELESAGVAEEDLRALEPLLGQTFTTRPDRDRALDDALGSDWRQILLERFQGTGIDPVFRREYGEIVGYYGDGYLGQTVLVIPSHGVVAVRQVRGDDDYDPEVDGFTDFKDLVLEWLESGE